MKVCKLTPYGWTCTLEECPPGFFLWVYGGDHDCIGFKSEYPMDDGDKDHNLDPNRPEVFNESGEYLSGLVTDVQPLVVSWEEE